MLLVALGVAGGAWFARQSLAPSEPAVALTSGTWLDRARDVGQPTLVDSTGKPFDRSGFVGHPSLVFFGFARCPDVCPTTLKMLADARREAVLPDLRVYLVSVDPERDTPEVLDRYLRFFDPQFIGLTGEPPAIATFARGMSAAIARVDLPGGDYTMDHSAAVYYLDENAHMAAVFTPPFDASRLAADLRTIAARARP